jgi:hypothetical protein
MTSQAAVSLASSVRKCDAVLSRILGDEVLLLDLDSEQYFGLGGVGSRVWELLEQTPQLDVVHRRLLDEFEVEAAQLETDLLGLISDLRERGLVQVSP